MAGTMIVLQLITPAPSADPLQRKMMAIGMPLFMLYVLWGAPSGLLLYWLVGNIVGFSQQFIINRLTRSEDDQSAAGEAPARETRERVSERRSLHSLCGYSTSLKKRCKRFAPTLLTFLRSLFK